MFSTTPLAQLVSAAQQYGLVLPVAKHTAVDRRLSSDCITATMSLSRSLYSLCVFYEEHAAYTCAISFLEQHFARYEALAITPDVFLLQLIVELEYRGHGPSSWTIAPTWTLDQPMVEIAPSTAEATRLRKAKAFVSTSAASTSRYKLERQSPYGRDPRDSKRARVHPFCQGRTACRRSDFREIDERRVAMSRRRRLMRIVVGAKVAARRTRAMEVEVARRSLRMMGEPQAPGLRRIASEMAPTGQYSLAEPTTIARPLGSINPPVIAAPSPIAAFAPVVGFWPEPVALPYSAFVTPAQALALTAPPAPLADTPSLGRLPLGLVPTVMTITPPAAQPVFAAASATDPAVAPAIGVETAPVAVGRTPILVDHPVDTPTAPASSGANAVPLGGKKTSVPARTDKAKSRALPPPDSRKRSSAGKTPNARSDTARDVKAAAARRRGRSPVAATRRARPGAADFFDVEPRPVKMGGSEAGVVDDEAHQSEGATPSLFRDGSVDHLAHSPLPSWSPPSLAFSSSSVASTSLLLSIASSAPVVTNAEPSDAMADLAQAMGLASTDTDLNDIQDWYDALISQASDA